MKQFDPIYTANDKNLNNVNCKTINLTIGDNTTTKICIFNLTYK